jgi:hypothetical protein
MSYKPKPGETLRAIAKSTLPDGWLDSTYIAVIEVKPRNKSVHAPYCDNYCVEDARYSRDLVTLQSGGGEYGFFPDRYYEFVPIQPFAYKQSSFTSMSVSPKLEAGAVYHVGSEGFILVAKDLDRHVFGWVSYDVDSIDPADRSQYVKLNKCKYTFYPYEVADD